MRYKILFLVFSLFFAATCLAEEILTPFSDVPRIHEFFIPIQYFLEQGLVHGYQDHTFKPEQLVSRAETLKLIVAQSGLALPKAFRQTPFKDVKINDWFAPYAVVCFERKVVSGDSNLVEFVPARNVNKAEFLKMLFVANRADVSFFIDKESNFKDVPRDAWFASYINYAASLGVIAAQNSGLIHPDEKLNRGQAMDILYRFVLLKKASDTQFLLDHTEKQLSQIEVYIAANCVDFAKKTSRLAVDLSQQALKNMPKNNIVLGAAKLARAYDFLVDSFMLGLQKKLGDSAALANEAILKANEAWQVNHATQPIARHIKERAREVLLQVGGQEWPNGQWPAADKTKKTVPQD